MLSRGSLGGRGSAGAVCQGMGDLVSAWQSTLGSHVPESLRGRRRSQTAGRKWHECVVCWVVDMFQAESSVFVRRRRRQLRPVVRMPYACGCACCLCMWRRGGPSENGKLATLDSTPFLPPPRPYRFCYIAPLAPSAQPLPRLAPPSAGPNGRLRSFLTCLGSDMQ